jgi:alpha-tubulin suppressor-like RCC1 family protein
MRGPARATRGAARERVARTIAARAAEVSRSACAARTARLALAVALIVGLLVSAASAVARPTGEGAAAPAAEANVAPKVSKQPASATVEAGQSASFSAAASGTPAPTVQWEVSTDAGTSWQAIEGATAGTLTIPSAQAPESGEQLRAVFKNVAGQATSKAVTLTVLQGPTITRQPLSVTVEEGQSASFEAAASGSPAPTVKWESSSNTGRTWTAVAGGTSDRLTITAVTASISGREYRAAFKNTSGEALSATATLTVQKAPAIVKQPASIVADEGQSAAFEATASGFPTPSVQWEASADGGGSWSAVEGATSTRLSIASVTIAEDGEEYRASFANGAGSVTSAAATLTVQAAPLVTQQPASATIELGESASFEARASGDPTPALQWEVSSDGGGSWSAIAGATAARLTIASPSASESGRRYRAMFTNVAGTTTSNSATLTVASTRFSALAWGSNTYRQLGDGYNEPFSSVPVLVSGLQFVTAVSAGGRHSLALLADGTVVAWGANGSGQLGDAGTSESAVPVPVEGLSGVTAISAGANHSLALLSNGTVMAWGNNENGQLGIGSGSIEESTVPAPVKALSGVTAIAAGTNFSLALLANGTVMAWGENESGQLGTGTFGSSDAPVAVKKLTGVTAIAAGGEFSLALLSNGTVQAWGDDTRGELGNVGVEEANSRTAVPVEQLAGVTAIAAGARHALALLSSGAVMAWGDDTNGELGNGTVKPSETAPVAVSGLSGATAISAGTQDSAALLRSGSVMTWGTNSQGVLGAGSSEISSDVPVAVVGLRKVSSVSAGRTQMLAFGEPLPIVTGLRPQVGSSGGGTTVTISGERLAGATAVQFGATQASSFAVGSESSITAVAPPGLGTVDVTVTTPSGTSPANAADRFSYAKAPTITKLSLKSGAATGGATVTITGSEFKAATQVSFGQTSASEFTVNSPTSITAVAPPAAAGQVGVSITNPIGTSAASSKARFTYTPVIESLSPSTGPPSGGTSVTVTGAGFALGASSTTFKFGKKKAKSVDCTSSTACLVAAPAQAPGAVEVIATVAKAKSVVDPEADRYTYG